jgi:hypothetical protein
MYVCIYYVFAVPPALTTEGKNILPQYLVGKNVAKQHGCRDRFDQSQKVSWFDFQGLV